MGLNNRDLASLEESLLVAAQPWDVRVRQEIAQVEGHFLEAVLYHRVRCWTMGSHHEDHVV